MMEASSPLAAMQPPTFMGCGYNAERSSYMSMTAKLGPSNFNFKEMSMKHSQAPRSQADYFSMRPVRGSSPTASLAADLSQNFHIDQSPQLPTPRRALFSNSMFAARGNPNITTPPVPSSSPGILDTMDMDLSPLPHKAPYHAVEIQLQSPTPEPTPADAMIVPSPPPSDAMTEIGQMPPPEKKRPLRPSLSRVKGLTTTCIPQQPNPEAQLPPFKFGNYSSKPSNSVTSEIFESSPVQERPSPRLGAALPVPRPRTSTQMSMNRNGSPIGQHVRKASNPVVRPRKQFRRSLSMYEHPEDVIRDKEAPPPMPSIMDIEVARTPQLPHFIPEGQVSELPRITKETMIDILDGRYNGRYEKLVIIDCRFEYEYHGGHIAGAVNFNDKEKLAHQLFDLEEAPPNALLVFHCEYSAHRAPLVAKFIRNKDRCVNADRYPALTYPETYILDGGYSAFFKDYQNRCFPQNYVEMDAKEHAEACERGLGKVKQRTKLMRAHTYAIGQHSPGLDSSPTAMGRSRIDSDDMELSLDYTPAPAHRPGIAVLRALGGRQFSY